LKKKPLDVKYKVMIAVAVIGTIGSVSAAYLQSPLADTQWKERSVVDISLGDHQDYPKKILQKDDDGYYYVDLLARNRGINDGKIIAIVIADGATVNFDKNEDFIYSKSLKYTIMKI
jgi:hypothetical protein